jgi:hypothetical protein
MKPMAVANPGAAINRADQTVKYSRKHFLTCLSHGRSIRAGKNGIPSQKLENPGKGADLNAVFANSSAVSSELSPPRYIGRRQATVSQTHVSSLYYVDNVNKT